MISIAVSPCPNDTFGFYHFLTGSTSCKSAFFDIETLNQLAQEGSYDIIKMSASTFAHVSGNYHLLPTGTAFTTTAGPLLISRARNPDIEKCPLAIPGKNTTAYFLYKLLFGEPKVVIEAPYHDIPALVARGDVSCGLLIHETRFALPQYSLNILCDLSQEYFSRFSEYLPLGVVAIHKTVPAHIQKEVSQSITRSFSRAKHSPQLPLVFSRQFAQEQNPRIVQKHIQTYVSHETYNLSKSGESTIRNFMTRGIEAGFFPKNALEFEIVR